MAERDPRLEGKRGLRRLLAVLGAGEIVMLLAAGLGALLLLLYLGRVLEGGPAVLTPVLTPRA